MGIVPNPLFSWPNPSGPSVQGISRDVMEYQQQTMGWIIYNDSTTLELHFGIADWGHCFDGIYFLAFYKLTYRPLSSHPTMYRGTTMYTTSTILQRACQAPNCHLWDGEINVCSWLLGLLTSYIPITNIHKRTRCGYARVNFATRMLWRKRERQRNAQNEMEVWQGRCRDENKKGQGEGWNWNLSFVSGFRISRSLKLRRSSIFSG